MTEPVKKTSEDWVRSQEFVGLVVMDPDGWDRHPDRFQKAWHEDKITRQEFEQRLLSSTIMWSLPKL